MEDLKDIINLYLKKSFLKKDDNYYFGKLRKCDSYNTPNDNIVGLEIDGVHSGYLFINPDKPYHEVSYSGENERFKFDVFPDKIKIALEQYQITKEIPVLPQAITKEDWITPKQIDISQDGDYTSHRHIMEKSFDKFKKYDKSELWLPSFIYDL